MTTRRLLPVSLTVLLVFFLALPSARAESWWLQAGWTHSDVGLADEGDGFWTGVEGRQVLGGNTLELAYSVAYVQKAGSQVMLFSDVNEGNRLGRAEVTLHVLEPMVTIGAVMDAGPFRIKLYGGGAVGLKLSEQWDQPPGAADRTYSYENLDLAGVTGLDLRRGAWLVTVLYSAGLLDQLLTEGVAPVSKSSQAEDPLGGSSLPVAGQNIACWRLGVGYRFGG